MLLENLKNYKIILASHSPRRQYLLKELGIDFEIKIKDNGEIKFNEVYPKTLKKEQIALYNAGLKAKACENEISDNTILITADTIVCLGNEVLNKPDDYDDAVKMLNKLSGKKHQVITGVCIKSTLKNSSISFYDTTNVYFKELTRQEITYYVNKFKPYDKAGAYGIQEWIGYIGIEKIEGSYFNVMGLPVQKLYEELKKYIIFQTPFTYSEPPLHKTIHSKSLQ